MTPDELQSTMDPPLLFLIVDENDIMRSLVARALMRRFGDALVQQCGAREAARFAAKAKELTTIVVAGARNATSPIHLVREIRKVNADVPIVFLSVDATHAAAMGAGASYLLDPQNWVRIGDIVATIVRLSLRHCDAMDVELARIA